MYLTHAPGPFPLLLSSRVLPFQCDPTSRTEVLRGSSAGRVQVPICLFRRVREDGQSVNWLYGKPSVSPLQLSKPTVNENPTLLRDSLCPNHFQQRRVASYLLISTPPLPILAAELHYLVAPLAVFLD
ncbi:uncharacterized protein LACBIDRAFT_317524 [Laccaria bicolor S238N-H82]|uniref:Predicted protein n=1 Tax=Laccaria bicolor (strain S238N-H82 / ATCC MYA-4686) TaxID=486041 RepID=B0E1W7_LACBS|nr:uncharacterized protein LACBIDRAFT_317524 [Laccaria bicolor S238N-H82]EDQ99163.1 predicted protein [Laccaria bicolor S238N-H82]|eukprot:XP_001890180.1 predicted protein [Laccaria bicolor S238N-H82]